MSVKLLPWRLTWQRIRALAVRTALTIASVDDILLFDSATGALRTIPASLLKDAPAGLALPWKFHATTTAGPAAGLLRLNHATPASVTSVFVHETAQQSLAASTFLAKFVKGSEIKITKRNSDGTVFWLGTVVSNTDNGSDRTIVVTHTMSNGTFTADDDLLLSFSNTPVPALPGAGNFKLRSADGVLAWVADA